MGSTGFAAPGRSTGAMATNMARALPATSIALAAGLMAGGMLLGNRLLSRRPSHRSLPGTRPMSRTL